MANRSKSPGSNGNTVQSRSKKTAYEGKILRNYLIANGWERVTNYRLKKGDDWKCTIKERKLFIYHKIIKDNGGFIWDLFRVVPFKDINFSELNSLSKRGKIKPMSEVIIDKVSEIVNLDHEDISKYFFCLQLLDIAESMGYTVDEVLKKALLTRNDDIIKSVLEDK